MANKAKPARKFPNRKAKIKQYKIDVQMAILEWIKETLIEGGIPEVKAKKIAREASKYEPLNMEVTAKEVIADYLMKNAVPITEKPMKDL